MLTFPFQYLVILLVVVVCVLILGIIVGIIINQCLRNGKTKNEEASTAGTVEDSGTSRLPRDFQRGLVGGNNTDPGSSYHYPNNGYHRSRHRHGCRIL